MLYRRLNIAKISTLPKLIYASTVPHLEEFLLLSIYNLYFSNPEVTNQINFFLKL